MSRFLWQVRREVWEHKAIWVAPLIVIGCLALSMLVSRLHLGPDIEIDGIAPLAGLSDAKLARLVMIAYAGLTVVVFAVMGIIAFFYAIDALYADRRDRSVLFWKSLPLSDAESVFSKFVVASVLIPMVAAAAAVLAQFVVAAVASARLAMTGFDAAGLLWHPEAVLGGLVIALLAGVTAAFWYAPVLAYLMLASSWAPRAPFLWAVLPPVALIVGERLLFYTDYVGDFVGARLFGIARVLRDVEGPDADPSTDEEVRAEVARVADLDVAGNLLEFFRSPELWLGLAAAGLLLAAAIWVRRYRDETT
jgi:ABC-2 type transport system permease protein